MLARRPYPLIFLCFWKYRYLTPSFERPDFNRMLDDIEAGKIDVVITKDLSRLGRDHLKVGHFTEIYFPMKNVRYIAVNDCVDTASKNNDIAALKNVINEFYSRDNSRKIRSSIRARAKAGLYRTAFNPKIGRAHV